MRIPFWGILSILIVLQCMAWIWICRRILKRVSFFERVDLPLLDAVFLGGGLKTCAYRIDNDTRRCSSPECDRSWPLGSCPQQHPLGRSRSSRNRTCGVCGTSKFGQYIRNLIPRLETAHKEECVDRIVVYSVALGSSHEKFLWDDPKPFNETTQMGTKLNSTELLERHGNCFFTFILQNETVSSPKRTADAIDWVIPIPIDILPYRNHRRNTKLIKLQGHVIFPWSRKLIWQDTKFRRPDFSHTRPIDYERWFRDHVDGVCAGFYNLPKHENSFGRNALEPSYRNNYLDHCETVVEVLRSRPTVTDSRAALLHQCREYQRDPKWRFETELLSIAMIDSAFMGWDLQNEPCRTFVADLTCTWLDELHCYSDRDQISFPQVIRRMNLRPQSRAYVDPVATNVEFRTEGRSMARFTMSQCHWYYQEMDQCYHKDLHD